MPLDYEEEIERLRSRVAELEAERDVWVERAGEGARWILRVKELEARLRTIEAVV